MYKNYFNLRGDQEYTAIPASSISIKVDQNSQRRNRNKSKKKILKIKQFKILPQSRSWNTDQAIERCLIRRLQQCLSTAHKFKSESNEDID